MVDDILSDAFLLLSTILNGFLQKVVIYMNKYNMGHYWSIMVS